MREIEQHRNALVSKNDDDEGLKNEIKVVRSFGLH